MRNLKLSLMRLGLILLIGSVALGSWSNARPAQAQSLAPKVGVVCTMGTGLNPTFTLEAQAGYIQLPDMETAYMWSYALAGGAFQHPGPTLCVNEGDTVTVVLQNAIPDYLGSPVRVSLMFPGQENVLADGLPAQPDLANNSLTNSIAPGGSIAYSFVASKPGTFIYESGTDPKLQIAMGLFGALIVRPSLGANYVYNEGNSQYTPGNDFMAMLSEIDPFQHQAVSMNRAFNMDNYRPRYYLINGRGFPDTIADNFASWLPSQPYGALARIYPYDPGVERFINVGTETFPFHPHANNGLLIGRDGYPLKDGGQDLSMEKFAFNIGPGQAWDVIFSWHDAESYSPANQVPVTVPDLANVQIGMFYSGSPYLGVMETMPPGINTLNQCGEYYIISHNHALFQLDSFNMVMSGPITYLRVDPPQPNNCP